MSMRVLGLALYGDLAASTRYRLGQYVPHLAARGIELSVHSLLDNNYLKQTFAGKRKPLLSMLKGGAARMRTLLAQKQYDAVMLHCELFPLLPGPLEALSLRVPYLYDFDDAFYLRYTATSGLGRFRSLLGTKFDHVMKHAAAVTAGNNTLASYAKAFNQNTQLLPTVVDTSRYLPKLRSKGREFVIGWIGSPSTAPYLEMVHAPLSRLGQEGPVRLVVIGGYCADIPNVSVEHREWAEGEEVGAINEFDVGIMPLPDDAWARGKCAFKLIQYLACGVPAVASPVGANSDVVGADAGMLASGSDEWYVALRRLRDDPECAAEMGRVGRKRVEACYSLDVTAPILANVLLSIGKKRN